MLLLVGVPRVRAADPSTPISLGPDRGWIDAIAMSPGFSAAGSAWAAPFGGHLFATHSSAGLWHEAAAGETDPVVTGLTVSPTFSTDRTVFAAADDGVFRSRDSGENWALTSRDLNGHFCREVVLSASYPVDHTLYVATDAGVYTSRDNGSSFNSPETGTASVTAVATSDDRTSASVLFAGPSAGGLSTSNDAGRTWRSVSSFPSDRVVLAIAMSPDFGSDGTILVGTDRGVWVTSDRAGHWSQVDPGDRISTIVVSPNFPSDRLAFAASASGSGVLETRDGGLSWTATGSLSMPFVESLAISPDFTNDRTLLAGTAGAGVFVSRTGGLVWESANSGLHGARISDMQLSSSGLLVAGNGGVSRLPVGDTSWVDIPTPTPFVTGLAASARFLALGTRDQGLLLSSDGGATWSSSSVSPAAVSAVSLSPNFSSDQTAVLAAGYVYTSHDSGATWAPSAGMSGNDVQRFTFSPDYGSDGTIWASTLGHGVYVSTSRGAVWQSRSNGLPSGQISDVALPARYDASGVGYAATTSGVYVTSDQGAHWSAMASQPPVGVITALGWEPDGTLLAGTEKGMFQYANDAWERLGGSWDGYVTAITATWAAAGIDVYAGTLGSGVWRFSLLNAPATAVGTASATPDASPTPTRQATVVRASPSATGVPASHGLHPKIRVLPSPLVAGAPAAVLVIGPGRGTVALSLTAKSWKRVFQGTLPPDGRSAFGFVSPASTMSVRATVRGRRQTATVHLTVKVIRPPSHPLGH